MAPHKNDHQEDLHAPLIPADEEHPIDPEFQQTESPSEQSSLLSDGPLDVVIVQPNENLDGVSRSAEAGGGGGEGVCEGKSARKSGKKKGPEVPVNCPHLETALFFFGIAGMVVSVLMLLQHIIGNLISYY